MAVSAVNCGQAPPDTYKFIHVLFQIEIGYRAWAFFSVIIETESATEIIVVVLDAGRRNISGVAVLRRSSSGAVAEQ
jgi:hypothetical protein